MYIRQILTLLAVALTVQANADNAAGVSSQIEKYLNMEPLKLEVPEMKAELGTPAARPVLDLDVVPPTTSPKMDFDFFKSKTNPGVKPYKFMDDMTFVGIPLFVAGWAIKGDKAMFRVNQKAEKGGKE